MTETPQFINLREFIEEAQHRISSEIKDTAAIEEVARWLVDSFSSGILVHTKPMQNTYESHANFAGVDWFLLVKQRSKET